MREAQVLQGAIDRVVRHRERKLLVEPHDQIARPPANHAVRDSEIPGESAAPRVGISGPKPLEWIITCLFVPLGRGAATLRLNECLRLCALCVPAARSVDADGVRLPVLSIEMDSLLIF